MPRDTNFIGGEGYGVFSNPNAELYWDGTKWNVGATGGLAVVSGNVTTALNNGFISGTPGSTGNASLISGTNNSSIEIHGNGPGTAFIDLASTAAADFDWRVSVTGAAPNDLRIDRLTGTTNKVFTNAGYYSATTSYPHSFQSYYWNTAVPGGTTQAGTTAIVIAGGAAAASIQFQVVAPYAGSIVAISAVNNGAAPTNITWAPAINGVVAGFPIVIAAGTSPARGTLPKGALTFNAGDILQTRVSFPAGGPYNTASQCCLWVEFTNP